MDWMQLIGSYAFPIVACVGLGWYLKYTSDRNREDQKEQQKQYAEQIALIQEQHSEEIKALREEMGAMNKTLTELVIIMRTNSKGDDGK